MKSRMQNLWETLRTSFWFVPTLMLLLSIGLALLTLYLDHEERYEAFKKLSWAWTGGASAAREMLSTIAGSMMTVTGITFSITIVTLTLASSQFGPRVLRNFMRDRGNQLVLGTFISTFTFSMLVLGRVRGLENTEFIPYISITVAVILALASLGVLIYFIHHVADSIQAENLVANIADELDGAMDRLFPVKLGQAQPQEKGAEEADRIKKELQGKSVLIRSTQSGYLQSIEAGKLLNFATRHGLMIQLHRRPGSFVAAGSVLAEAWPLEVYPGDLEEKMNHSFLTGRHRTPVQDAAYPMHQLVQVALRALSPSLNDPYTAINCIDRLGSALLQLTNRQMPSAYRYDDLKQLRIISDVPTFKEMAGIAFNQIRENGSTSVAVTVRMLETIAVIAEQVQREEDRTVLMQHAERIATQAKKEIDNEYDKGEVDRFFRKAKLTTAGHSSHALYSSQ